MAAESWFAPEWPLPPGVKALQTIRCNGLSQAPWASFNLGDHVGDDPLTVAANRSRLVTCLPEAPVWLEQVHGVAVARIDELPANATRPLADAAVARLPGRVCAVMTADCLPLLLCSRNGDVVAAVHAGWRGLNAGVIEAAVAAMDVPGKEILAWLGPAIGPRAFEVGDDVRDAFILNDASAAQAFRRSPRGRWLANLYQLARLRLDVLGIGAISGGEECTFEQEERYFSYRRDGISGRMASLIWREAGDAGRSGS